MFRPVASDLSAISNRLSFDTCIEYWSPYRHGHAMLACALEFPVGWTGTGDRQSVFDRDVVLVILRIGITGVANADAVRGEREFVRFVLCALSYSTGELQTSEWMSVVSIGFHRSVHGHPVSAPICFADRTRSDAPHPCRGIKTEWDIGSVTDHLTARNLSPDVIDDNTVMSTRGTTVRHIGHALSTPSTLGDLVAIESVLCSDSPTTCFP